MQPRCPSLTQIQDPRALLCGHNGNCALQSCILAIALWTPLAFIAMGLRPLLASIALFAMGFRPLLAPQQFWFAMDLRSLLASQTRLFAMGLKPLLIPETFWFAMGLTPLLASTALLFAMGLRPLLAPQPFWFAMDLRSLLDLKHVCLPWASGHYWHLKHACAVNSELPPLDTTLCGSAKALNNNKKLAYL